MIHQPSAGTQGQITDMAIHLKRLEVVKKRMNRILSEKDVYKRQILGSTIPRS